jgi:DivIVA domain-containing protein
VTLILLYLLVLIVIAALLFVIASAVFGRGEELPPLPRATTATMLPASGVTGADVDAVKFTQTLRGYKTSEVDWVLDRLGGEIELLRGQLSAVDERLARSADSVDERLAVTGDNAEPGRDDG